MSYYQSVGDDYGLLIAGSIVLSEPKPLQTVMTQATKSVMEILNCSAGKLWLFAGKNLHLVSLVNISPQVVDGFVLKPGEGLTGLCFQHGSPVTSVDLLSDKRVARPDIVRQENIKGFAAVPLKLCSRTIGVLSVLDHHRRAFTPKEIETLRFYATRVALALHHCTFFPEMSAQWLGQFRQDNSRDITPPTQPIISDNRDKLSDEALPKGINAATLQVIYGALRNARRKLTCQDISRETNLSLITVRKYLSYLERASCVKKDVSYGSIGRPRYYYSL